MAVFLCLYSILIVAIDVQVFPSVLTRLGGNSVQQGLLLSSLFFLFPLSSAFAGLTADKTGKKTVLSAGAAFLTIPFGISAIVKDLWIRTLAVLLFGIGMGAVEGQSTALLADLYPGKERSILNLSQVFFCIGAAGGPFLISLAYRLHPGLKLPHLLWSVTIITSTVMIGFFLLNDKTSTSASLNPSGFKNVLQDREGRLLLLSIFLYVAPEMGTAGWLAKYTEEYLFLSKASAPLSLTLFWGGLGVSRALVGFLFHSIKDIQLLSAAFLLTFIFQISAFTVKTPAAALVFFFFIGFGMGTVWPTLVAMISMRFKQSSGSAVGLAVAVGATAIPIIHQVIGILSRESLFGLQYTLLGLGLLTLFNLYIIYTLYCIQNQAELKI